MKAVDEQGAVPLPCGHKQVVAVDVEVVATARVAVVDAPVLAAPLNGHANAPANVMVVGKEHKQREQHSRQHRQIFAHSVSHTAKLLILPCNRVAMPDFFAHGE